MASPPMSLSRRPARSERVIETLLFLAAALSIVTTLGIITVLTLETVNFFGEVRPIDFLTGTVWSATIRPFAWGIWPLLSGTLLVAGIALIIGVPLGLLSAILLSEYASQRVRTVVKPLLETIAGIPTIVLGFFAINFVAPQVLKPIFGANSIGTFSALAAGIVVGVLVTPLIASISEDAMRAVPRGPREAGFAMGATRFEVVRKIVVPAALSGIMASIILAMSRAIGETMAVLLSAGGLAQLTLDPRQPVQTMTGFIADISMGETAQGSTQFRALFAVGAALFVLTLALNLLSSWFVRKFRTVY